MISTTGQKCAVSVAVKIAHLAKDNNMTTENKPKGTCGCGRSPTGNCIGWHGLDEDEYQERLAEYRAFNQEKEEE